MPFCEGDALQLANYYYGLGLRSLYVADLDAIAGKAMQWAPLASLLEVGFDRVLLDIGWTGSESAAVQQGVAALSKRFPGARWIAATESCRARDSIAALAACVQPEHVVLGLDFRSGQLLGRAQRLEDWIETAIADRVRSAVVLDLAAVGTSAGPVTMAICRTVRQLAPCLQIYSGGGVRDALDAEQLLEAGCQGVLVATSLFPGASRWFLGADQGVSGFDFPLESFNG